MKRCPQCNRTYMDESLSYCLEDGTLLSPRYDLPVTQTLQYPFVPSPPVAQAPSYAQPAAHGRGRSVNAVHIIILVLAALLTGSVVALVYEKRKSVANSKSVETEPPTAAPARDEQKTSSSASAAAPTASPSVAAKENQSRFSVNSCGSIKDSRTGLEWYVGPDRNVTWDEAREWAAALRQCGGNWRMPSIEEVRALYNPQLTAGTGFYLNGRYYPAHIDPVFSSIGGGSWVWSNERTGAGEARSFNLNQGIAVAYSTANTYYATRAFAVR